MVSFIQGAIEKTVFEEQSKNMKEELSNENKDPLVNNEENKETQPEIITTKTETIDEKNPEKEITITKKTNNSIAPINNLADEELAEILSKQEAKIRVVGCGGAGCNTLNRINELGITGAETIIINTDAQDLLAGNADEKILIGKDLTKGLGAGGKPQIGRDSAKESEKAIRESLAGSDLVFITCGLGGGTGTGSAPVVADIARKTGALVVTIATVPFKMEGGRRMENAMLGAQMLEKSSDTLILIPNDKLLSIAQDLPLQTAFKVADEILASAVKGITELITTTGLVNLDFADLTTVLGNGGISLIGVGESDSENKAQEAVDKVLDNPLLDVDITGAQGAIINVIGGSDMRLDEAKTIVEKITERLDSHARVIWGAQISEDMEGTIKVLLVITGVDSEHKSEFHIKKGLHNNRDELEDSLGIRFV